MSTIGKRKLTAGLSPRPGGGDLASIVTALSAAIRSGNNTNFCNALIVPDESMSWLTEDAIFNCPNVKSTGNVDFTELLRHHLFAVMYRGQGQFADAFKSEMAALKLIIGAFKEPDMRNLLDIAIYRLISLCSNSSKKAGQDVVGQCHRDLNEMYRYINRDVKNCPYYLALINALASLPGSESFCRPLYSSRDTFESSNKIWAKDAYNYKIYPVGHVATFAFYCGRAKLLEDNIEVAVYWLLMAFKYSSVKNRYRVLSYLIPAQMCMGVMPSEEIATIYDHHILYEVSLKVRQGDVHGFEQLLYTHQRSFIKIGIYLALERLKFLVYRNLFKRLHMALSNANNIYLETTLLPILHGLGLEDMDLSELECILSNLIFHKAIKGNLQQVAGGRMLVLSPTNTFPPENMKNIATEH